MRYIPAGAVVGRYRVDGLLGRGGMAIVYLATHESLGRQVALKLLDPGLAEDRAFAARFRREGELQASLEHPHVVTVYEAGDSDAGLFIVMQLIRGPTLAAMIAGGSLTAARTVALLEQIASALDAAHAAGLVHRDVKPRNVLVGEDDRAYLTDFGLSKLGSDSGLTVTGAVLGTLAYLAPEVIRGDRATPAADRYAFAALAFECLTGSVVFPRATQAAQLYAHTTEPVPSVSNRRPDLPAALDAVFERALAKAPGERPNTAAALVAAIRETLGDDLVATLPPPTPPRALDDDGATTGAPVLTPVPVSAPGRRRRAGGVLAAGLLAGAAVAAAAAVLLDDDPSARPVVAVPAPLAHTKVLGSDLTGAGSTRDCRGRDVTPGSAGCTIAQVRLPGATIVAPKDGVVRRWAVRSAFGELQLQVLRARNRGFFQVATSRDEFVGDAQVHAFPASISVDAGDVLGLKVVSGSGVGIRAETAGATTNRWLPRLGGVNQPPDRTPPGALAGELLLRVEYAPGEQAPTPRQVKGAAAAGLPAGTVVKSALRHVGGGPVAIRLVDLSGRAYALDLVRDGRRVARMEVPDFVPAVGDVDEFFVDGDGPGASHGLGIFLSYRRTDSDRLVSHAFYVLASGFGLVS